jgi:hypothetical protein
VKRTPWDVPEPEPTEPPDEKMLPLTTRLPVRYTLPNPELVERFEAMMMLLVMRLEAMRKLAMFASPVTLRDTMLPVEMLAVRTLALDKNAVPETLRLVTLAVRTFPEVMLAVRTFA